VWAWLERVLASREVGGEGSVVQGVAVGLEPGWVNEYGAGCGGSVVVRVEVEEELLERGEEGSGRGVVGVSDNDERGYDVEVEDSAVVAIAVGGGAQGEEADPVSAWKGGGGCRGGQGESAALFKDAHDGMDRASRDVIEHER